jgi:hypothetical protein
MSKRATLADVPLHRKGAAAPIVQEPTPAPEKADLIAVTVRLEPGLYERLKLHGVRKRRSNQAILVDALVAHLDAEGA